MNRKTASIFDRAVRYAQNVISGEIKANIWIKAVAKSFLELDTDKWDLRHDQLDKLDKFIPFIKGSKGEFAGVPLKLLEWQCFLLANLYGVFHKGTDERRYKTAIVFVARKNGKSTLLAALGTYALMADPWQSAGAEVYCAATKREQAKIVFAQMCESILQSRELKNRLVVQRDAILYPKKFGKVVPLSSDHKSLDGLSPTLSIVDEVAAHSDSGVWDVLRSALGSRKNPIIAAISTAGLTPGNFGNDLFDYGKKVAIGAIEDEQALPLIYAVDDDDDPLEDESCWIKANPSLGYTITEDYLRSQLSEARALASSRINFLVKHNNIFVRGDDFWLNAEKWRSCEIESDIYSRDDIEEVYLGLDLSSTQDLTAIAGVALTTSGDWVAFAKCYLPEDAIRAYMSRGFKQIAAWVNDGYITSIPGAVVDYNLLESDIKSLCEKLPVKEIAYDRWNASALVNNLTEADVAEMVAFSQSFGGMSGAIRELETRYLAGKISYIKNPVLDWCMSNVIAVNNDNGDIKFSKGKSTHKIDAAVALVMATGRAALHFNEPSPAFHIL